MLDPNQRTVSKQGLKFVLKALGTAIVIMVLFGLLGFRVNLTGSYPVGIWRKSGKTPEKGDLVLFNLPFTPLSSLAYERGYIRAGYPDGYAPLMKRLAAVPGDVVTVTSRIVINGKEWPNGEIFTTDSKGREVRSLATSGPVQEGQCWLLSDYNARSFDSRYFGPVPLSHILGVMHPIIVWDSSR